MDLPCTLAVRPVRADAADAKQYSRNAATTFGHAWHPALSTIACGSVCMQSIYEHADSVRNPVAWQRACGRPTFILCISMVLSSRPHLACEIYTVQIDWKYSLSASRHEDRLAMMMSMMPHDACKPANRNAWDDCTGG